MRVLLQRVSQASVTVAGETIAEGGPGLLVLLGLYSDDGDVEIDWMIDKLLGLRIFPDGDGRMNRSVTDIGGDVVLVSQFTLAADTSRGRRPGFTRAAPPEVAKLLYDTFLQRLRAQWPNTSAGRFGADMQVSLINDGPVTLLLERGAIDSSPGET